VRGTVRPLRALAQVPRPRPGVFAYLPGLGRTSAEGEVEVEPGHVGGLELRGAPAVGDTLEAPAPDATVLADHLDWREDVRVFRHAFLNRRKFALGHEFGQFGRFLPTRARFRGGGGRRCSGGRSRRCSGRRSRRCGGCRGWRRGRRCSRLSRRRSATGYRYRACCHQGGHAYEIASGKTLHGSVPFYGHFTVPLWPLQGRGGAHPRTGTFLSIATLFRLARTLAQPHLLRAKPARERCRHRIGHTSRKTNDQRLATAASCHISLDVIIRSAGGRVKPLGVRQAPA